MRLTVIYDDHYISVDGYGIHFVDNWPFDEENIHAVQWYDDHGELEYKNTDPNFEFTDYITIEKYISHFNTEKERIFEEKRKIEEEENKRQQMWHLAMQELQQELNETKMNYELAINNNKELGSNLELMSQSYKEAQENLLIMGKSYDESKMHLMIANQINDEIQNMQSQIASLSNPDDQILNIIQPNVIDNISEFSDGVDMSLFEDNNDSIIQQIEEIQSLNTERNSFDISLLEDEFDIELLEDVNLVNPQENEEDYILSIESLLDELEIDDDDGSGDTEPEAETTEDE
jgi:hypothetical protein